MELDAQLPQPIQGCNGRGDAMHEPALGDLEPQGGGCQAGLLEHRSYVVHEARIGELLRREVHVDPHRACARHRVLPVSRVATRLPQHPPADRNHEARMLCHRQEVLRHEDPPLRLLPALARTSRPSSENGAAMLSSTRRATCSASEGPATSSSSSVNSSPPSRATTSPGRTLACSRCAISTSRRSPAACPRVSFTSLKWSQSKNKTPNR